MTRRVAIVAFSAPPYSAGGVASAHYNLFQSMRQADVDAHLFTFGDYKRPDDEHITRSGSAPWVSKFLRKVNGRIFRLLDSGKTAFQIVDIIASLVGSWRMGKEITRFAPDVVVLSDHGAPGLMLKKPLGTKWILVSHHNPGRFMGAPLFSEFSSLDVDWALSFENRVLRKVDAVVCPTNYMKDWFEKSYVYQGPIYVIPNLINETIFEIAPNVHLRARMGIKPKDPIIYLPSGGSRLKGAEYVVEIIRCLAQSHNGDVGFYIPGIIEAGFRNYMKNLPTLAHPYLAGQVSYNQHIANVKACSFGISPSLMENYSMALLEAAWCGVPMLAFRTGGNAEIIRDESNGFLVDVGDTQKLCELGRRLFDEKNLANLKEKTFKYSRQYLSQAKPLQAYLDLMASL